MIKDCFCLFRDFIKSLASFNKPIVAGVQGAAVGLGVTMLPLFDLVIASDKATFSTPYGKLGQIAEGAAVFTLSHILGSAIVSAMNMIDLAHLFELLMSILHNNLTVILYITDKRITLGWQNSNSQ